MADDVFKTIDTFGERVSQLQAAMKPDAAAAAIDVDLQAFDRAATIHGVYVPDAAARQRYERAKRDEYDRARQAEAAAIEQDQAALIQTIAVVVTSYRHPPKESDKSLAAMREISAFLRYQNKSQAELGNVYTATKDEDNPTLIGLLESGAFTTTATDPMADAEALRKFRAAVEARQLARVPVEWQQAAEKVRALTGSVAFQEQLRHLRSGRGVAMVQRQERAAGPDALRSGAIA